MTEGRVAHSGGDSYHYQVRFDYGLALGFILLDVVAASWWLRSRSALDFAFDVREEGRSLHAVVKAYESLALGFPFL